MLRIGTPHSGRLSASGSLFFCHTSVEHDVLITAQPLGTTQSMLFKIYVSTNSTHPTEDNHEFGQSYVPVVLSVVFHALPLVLEVALGSLLPSLALVRVCRFLDVLWLFRNGGSVGNASESPNDGEKGLSVADG
eukprot:1385355-Amorphochlora_amoeboformis.AAC.1